MVELRELHLNLLIPGEVGDVIHRNADPTLAPASSTICSALKLFIMTASTSPLAHVESPKRNAMSIFLKLDTSDERSREDAWDASYASMFPAKLRLLQP